MASTHHTECCRDRLLWQLVDLALNAALPFSNPPQIVDWVYELLSKLRMPMGKGMDAVGCNVVPAVLHAISGVMRVWLPSWAQGRSGRAVLAHRRALLLPGWASRPAVVGQFTSPLLARHGACQLTSLICRPLLCCLPCAAGAGHAAHEDDV